MKALARKETGLTRPLKVLVPLIKDELEAAGEMLLEAKEQVEYGEWTAWVERNFHRSPSQARAYMRLAAAQNGRTRTFSTLTEAANPNERNEPSRSWQAPVREIASRVNVEALAQERENRQKEQRLLRELALKLIDIGYRVLAAKLHPDTGGSHEAMKRLNEVRRLLREAI